MAYEEKSVPSSGRGTVDYPVTGRLPRAGCRVSRVTALPQRDKVVTLLDKIRNLGHGISKVSPPQWGPI